MNSTIQKKLVQYSEEHNKKRKWISVALSLCAVVAVGTSCLLIKPAATKENDTFCGLEEHAEHCEECFEEKKVLVCTIDDGIKFPLQNENGDTYSEVIITTGSAVISDISQPHIHTDECYETVSELICGMTVHKHTLQCFSNPGADVETEAAWEELPDRVGLTGDIGTDIAALAKSQLGYRESILNYEVKNDGSTVKGYTRYGDWFGNKYGDWNTMFAVFCAHFAGVDDALLPETPDDQSEKLCENWADLLSDLGSVHYSGSADHIPSVGELVFFGSAGDPAEMITAERVGIVTELIANAGSGGAEGIKTVEGDIEDSVCERTYDIADTSIIGYASLDQSETVSESEFRNETFIFSAELETGLCVIVSGDVSALPYPKEEIVLLVEPVESSEDGEELSSGDEKDRIRLNISMLHASAETGNVEEAEPLGPVSMSISGLDTDAYTKVEVYHVDTEDGTPEQVESSLGEDGVVSLVTDHLSEWEVRLLLGASGTAISNLSDINSNKTYYLNNDITVSSTFNFYGLNATLDLNGHRITAGGTNPAIRISGGTLTIKDTGASNLTSSVVTGNDLWANTADYSNGKLTYYVTEVEPKPGSATGETEETLRKYEVSSGGMIVGNQKGRAFEVSGGTLNIEGGYVCNFKSDNGGAVYQTGGTVNISDGAVIAANIATNRGGAVYSNGQNAVLNIKGGVISGNTVNNGEGGGGVSINGQCVLNHSGGYVTNNFTSVRNDISLEYSGGGGILLDSAAVYNLEGGKVTGNKTLGGGGGIRTWHNWGGSSGSVYITSGFVSANNCTGAEGGGININAGGHMRIIPGQGDNVYITENVAGGGMNDDKFQHWGGGGIFCANDSCTVYILNSLITDNSAGGFGGGVAGCSTGRITTAPDNGSAIYDNDALGLHTSGSESAKSEDHAFAFESPVFMENGYQDYYCALTSSLSGGMLGGGIENWKGSADGVPVSSNKASDKLCAASVMGLTANPSDASKRAAEKVAQVFINGNESPTHGGGILANGHLVLGSVDKVEIYARLEMSGMKKLFDKDGLQKAPEAGKFSFVMVDDNGFEAARGTNDASGNIIFDRRLPFTAAGTFNYTIYEVVPADAPANLQYDANRYEVVVKVNEIDNGEHIPWMDEIKSVAYEFDNITVTQISGDKRTVVYNQNPGNDRVHGVSFKPTAGHAFENREVDIEQIKKVSVRAKKRWSDGSDNGKPAVTVELYKDGIATGQTADLKSANQWEHTWSNLDADASYSVVERPVSGYSPSYSVSYENQTTSQVVGTNEAKLYVKNGSYFVPATSIASGSDYIITNPDGDRILYTSNAHTDGAFNNSDVYEVQKKSGSIQINSKNYSPYYLASDIPAQGTYTAQTYTGGNGSSGRIIFKNKAVNSWLLSQDASGVFLKGTNGSDWSSGLRMYNGHLSIWYEWNTNSSKYIIWTGSQFDSAEKIGDIMLDEITGYTKVVTVTNTPVTSVSYSLDILKTEQGNASHVLPGAEFELTDGAGNALKFTKEANGNYKYSGSGSAMLVSSNTGRIKVTGLPSGTYTLIETKAPDGYRVAAPVEVKLDNSMTGTAWSCTVEDSPFTYSLPETGGIGPKQLYLAGAVLALSAYLMLSLSISGRSHRKKN